MADISPFNQSASNRGSSAIESTSSDEESLDPIANDWWEAREQPYWDQQDGELI